MKKYFEKNETNFKYNVEFNKNLIFQNILNKTHSEKQCIFNFFRTERYLKQYIYIYRETSYIYKVNKKEKSFKRR